MDLKRSVIIFRIIQPIKKMVRKWCHSMEQYINQAFMI